MSSTLFKPKALFGAIGIVIALSALTPGHAHANSSLRSEMNKMFGSMSNTTAPGVFETSRRGVISGGSVVVRNKIMNTSIVSFQPPSFNAGCGGIDLFGGSFSFINKEQFVQLARSIASNAASYAFYLALDAMSPSVRAIIDNIQKKIQELNQFFGNSCQLAQGLVTNAVSSYEKSRETKGGLAKSVIAGAGDIFETFTGNIGTAPTVNVPAAEQDKIQGNIVWQALKKKGVGGWFTYGGDNLNMAIMTVTGTVIIGPEGPAADGKGTSAKITEIPGGQMTDSVSLRTLVHGGRATIMKCDDNEKCLEPDAKVGISEEIVGFKQMVMNMLSGEDGASGIIQKARNGLALTQPEKNFLSTLPNSMGSMIFRLTRVSEDVARNFVASSAESIGREMAYEMLKAFSDAAITALLAEQSNPHATKAINLLKESRRDMYSDYALMVQSGPKVDDMMQRYNEILRAATIVGVNPDFYVPSTPTASGN